MENSRIFDLMEKLNEEQKRPVLDTEGAVLVIAGAGSGKTRVLTTRIAYLVLEKHIHPSNIMAITFTNKAAKEMKERLSLMVGDVSDMWVSTIHSMCVRILRRDIDKIGYDKNFTIYDDADKDKALKRVLDELGYDNEKFHKSTKSYISMAKNNGLNPLEFKKQYCDLRFVDDYYTIYQEYENYLARSNALDFDDLLCKTLELLANNKEVADYYAKKFQYVHIDEFQDTNAVQFSIARILSSYHGNLFVVGDDDQSIYSWRGAKIENILSFDDVYRGAKIYKLEQNYRSTKKILELANSIISNNHSRREKALWTSNPDGVKIETFTAGDENNEAGYVAIQIKNLMARNSHLRYGDFAVFMRVNALSRAFEQEFIKYGIPYRIYGGFRFFERKEIKDVLAYLKLIVNNSDDESFLRAIASPKRGVGDKTLRDLREFAVSENLSLFEACFRLENSHLASSGKSKLFNFAKMISSFINFAKENSIENLINHLLETTGFLEQFSEKTEENISKQYNVNELKNSSVLFSKDNPNTTLADYLNSIILSSDTDEINSDDCVTVATIHAVKGLEFPCVFLSGLDEDILPIARSLSNDDEIEEERRLMYVAVTRARERLYLTRAKSRYLYGRRENMMQSRFLKEAQTVLHPNFDAEQSVRSYDSHYDNIHRSDYVENVDFSPKSLSSGYSSNYAKSFLSSSKPQENKNVVYSKYKTGVKVMHKKFGEGVVIMVKGDGDNIIADVAFKSVGIKSLAIKFAPMEII